MGCGLSERKCEDITSYRSTYVTRQEQDGNVFVMHTNEKHLEISEYCDCCSVVKATRYSFR